jgi:hypothetical protein
MESEIADRAEFAALKPPAGAGEQRFQWLSAPRLEFDLPRRAFLRVSLYATIAVIYAMFNGYAQLMLRIAICEPGM